MTTIQEKLQSLFQRIKVDVVYAKEATLKSLEFFSLPKEWNFAYSDYGIYLCRGIDYIVLGYDTEMYHLVPLEDILSELKAQLHPLWGEHFQITKGNQPLVYCIDRFEKNPQGENLISDSYIQKLQPIHIVEQFKVHMED